MSLRLNQLKVGVKCDIGIKRTTGIHTLF